MDSMNEVTLMDKISGRDDMRAVFFDPCNGGLRFGATRHVVFIEVDVPENIFASMVMPHARKILIEHEGVIYSNVTFPWRGRTRAQQDRSCRAFLNADTLRSFLRRPSMDPRDGEPFDHVAAAERCIARLREWYVY